MAENELNMPKAAAGKLIASGDGAAALLYLYLLHEGSEDGAESALRLSGDEYAKARAVLRDLGLLPSSEKLYPTDQPPEYTVRDIKNRLGETPEFAGLVREVQRRLGRVLSGSDLVTLFGIYDYLGMPPEVILPLVAYCIEDCRRRYGEGRLPTLRSIEKEAYIWVRQDVLTPERADSYIRSRADSRSRMEAVKKALRIRGRELSPTEEKYIDSWLEMGFGPEALEIGYDRTIIKTGQLSWSYMNSIVRSWHAKGLHSVAEIEDKDVNKVRAPTQAQAPGRTQTQGGAGSASELERMRRFIDRIKKE